ncbi:MAG: hypothetical protein QNJ38_19475 [Prochloraceae cyanobacterium]|nr:hypothetical protein [Prochloraceae cyanobacterium]
MKNRNVIDKLKDEGLLVQFLERGPFANSYMIAKPKATFGNKRENSEFVINVDSKNGRDKILCDAPSVYLYPDNDKWIFQVWEFMPGPGPGDFREEFASISDAIPVILDYYFGNPAKMNPPELLEYANSYDKG